MAVEPLFAACGVGVSRRPSGTRVVVRGEICLLYPSDAADERSEGDLCGLRFH